MDQPSILSTLVAAFVLAFALIATDVITVAAPVASVAEASAEPIEPVPSRSSDESSMHESTGSAGISIGHDVTAESAGAGTSPGHSSLGSSSPDAGEASLSNRD